LTFLFQSLLWIGLPLVALPLLIHLINMRRHQRVQWAAMDFLLESQKRNKKWILLRQILLLMLRTSAVALIVCMLAGPVLMSQWGSLLGSGLTHHIVLLDDTYSMADRWNNTSAWREAKSAVDEVLDQATTQPGHQKLTLLRFSQVPRLSAGQEVEFADRELNRQTADEVNSRLEKIDVSEMAIAPAEVFQAVLALPDSGDGESKVVYVISDFRKRDWAANAQAKQHLTQLREKVADLHLIQCVEESRPNLAITKLEPESGIRAAGVETWMLLSVANYGDELAVAVPVSILQDEEKLPAVEFDEIAPGEEVTRRFRVAFPSSGAHELQAQLPGDAVATDNHRYFACDVPNSFPLLLVDGSPAGDDGFYLRTALSPGGSNKPGWSPRVEPVSFLRNHEELKNFAAIFLLDVSRLDEAEVSALEEYVKQGGGLAIFLGPESQRTFYNEALYRDGTGLMPVDLDIPTQLMSDLEENTADVVVTDHPVFRIFSGQRNSFLSVAQVNFYFAIQPTTAEPDPDVRVVARLQNGAPFVVEKKFGAGRVVVQLCKLSPKATSLGVWSNWSLNPVFPVVANELAGYLTATQRKADAEEVGNELRFDLAEAEYEPEIQVHSPASDTLISLTPQTADGQYVVDAGRGDVSGIWRFGLQPRQKAAPSRYIAVNVANGEGDLHHLDGSSLERELDGIDFRYSLASQINSADEQLAGFRLGDTALALLVLALLLEQWLAYKASYHGTGGSRS
jgi:hypothetical protein